MCILFYSVPLIHVHDHILLFGYFLQEIINKALSLYISEWVSDGAHLHVVTLTYDATAHSLRPLDLFPLKRMGLNGRHFTIGTIEVRHIVR